MRTFGYTPDDITTWADGVTPKPGVQLYVWAAEVGGAPLLNFYSSANGSYGWTYDTTADGLWLSAGLDGARWYVEAHEAVAALRDRVDTTETRLGGVEDELPLKLDVAAANSTYVPLGVTVDDLPTPFYIGHRGSSLLAPEEGMTCYRVAVAGGAHAIEADCRTLSDGTVGVMHDATVDRTTNGTGNVADFNSVTWSKLVIDSPGLMGTTGWPTEYAPLLEQVLREFGNKVIIAPQGYDAGVLPVLKRLCEELGINKRSVLYQSNGTDVNTAVTYGFPAMTVASTITGLDLSGGAAAGVKYVAVPEAEVTQAFVDYAHGLGMKVVAYAVNSHYRRDALVAIGVDGFFTDDPAYLRETMGYKKADLFALQEVTPGHHKVSGSGIGFVAPNELRVTGTSTSFTRLGYIKPTDPQNFTLDYQVKFAANAGISYFWLGNVDHWEPTKPANATYDGFLFEVMTNADGTGMIRMEEITDGARTTWMEYNTAITTYPAAGSWVKVRLTVTPSAITWLFPDTGQTATKTNSKFRPANRFGVGTGGGTVSFRSITVT